MEIKKLNKTHVYHSIYRSRQTSKQQIASDLYMGLTTVTQNLKLLEEEGLIQRVGYFDSTGGRKARRIRIVSDFRVSVGIEILKDRLHIALIDLYGEILFSKTCPVPFSSSLDYCQKLGELLQDFLSRQKVSPRKILGVSIALQGIISKDGETVSYGRILNHTKLKRQDFQAFLPYPCRLEHDSKAAAALESWRREELQDSIVLLLNHNLGSAIVLKGEIQQGLHSHSGTLEHMCLDPKGPACYCGKRGCFETYCSVKSLEEACREDLDLFFSNLRSGRAREQEVWEAYLSRLAFAIRNFMTVLELPVVLSGYLSPYLCQEDLTRIYQMLERISPFAQPRDFLFISPHGRLSPAAGAALFYIDEFLSEI